MVESEVGNERTNWLSLAMDFIFLPAIVDSCPFLETSTGLVFAPAPRLDPYFLRTHANW